MYQKKYCCILILVVVLAVLTTIFSILIYDEVSEFIVEQDVKNFFGNWTGEKYQNWDCRNKTKFCMDWFEQHDYDVMMVYGRGNTNHRWLLVLHNNQWKEFESVTFTFAQVHKNYASNFILI